MKKSTEIRSQIQAKLQELETLVGSEERSLSTEEKGKFDALTAEIESLEADEKRSIQMEEMRLKAASEEKRKQDAAAKLAGGPSGKIENKDEKNARDKFSVLSFIREVGQRQLTGLNAELHQEAVKEARDLGVSVKNFGIPSSMLKRDMTAGTDTAGGFAIETQKMGIIDYLENTSELRRLGADYMTGLVGDLSFPREDNSLVATWKAENATADELSPTLDEVTLSPKRLAAFVDISNQLMVQTSPNIEARIRRRLGEALGRGIDKAAIQGTGSSNQPTGILNTSGIGAVAMGTNGGAITWAKVVELFREVDVDNASVGQMGYLSNPLVKSAMQTILKSAGVSGYILDNAMASLNGYTLGNSNHVPSTLTKGTASGVCSAMIFGNYNDLMIGQWGGLDILVNPYTKGKEGLTEVIANVYADVAVARPQSFAAIQDITTA